ncbi:hypothetical protein [Streptomyces sp. N2A]|uniref:hypothetical protein n=1 Tax=Streptomyces sp. N2A TaxID=3073936 RepID=UPI00286FFCB6|nr:hypothetical protein [Streptomyces sp. N2A]
MRPSKRIALAAAAAAVIGGIAAAPSASAATSSCGGNVVATAVKYSYGNASCSISGVPGLKVTYRWTATDGYAAMQAFGMDANGVSHWYNCGSGGGACTVPWGNEIATPKIRAWDALRAARIDFTVS